MIILLPYIWKVDVTYTFYLILQFLKMRKKKENAEVNLIKSFEIDFCFSYWKFECTTWELWISNFKINLLEFMNKKILKLKNQFNYKLWIKFTSAIIKIYFYYWWKCYEDDGNNYLEFFSKNHHQVQKINLNKFFHDISQHLPQEKINIWEKKKVVHGSKCKQKGWNIKQFF